MISSQVGQPILAAAGFKPAQADLYLQAIINRHRLDSDRHPTISLQSWRFHKHVESITHSGSRAKLTALPGADTDLFLTLGPGPPLPTIQSSLADHFHGQIRNVAVRITHAGETIDLVPSRANTLWQSRHNTLLKTNVKEQIHYVRESGLLNEIRLLKIWRRRNALKFPSFALELAVIKSLSPAESISSSFLKLLEYLSTHFPTASLKDPANPSNIVSDTLTPLEKHRIAQSAATSLSAKSWPEIL